jgi:aryl-alcohol dehydrogenase-like predicted oxidoreductase
VRKQAASDNVTVATLAFTAALAQPWADVVLTGAVTPQQLDDNVSALSANLVNEIDTSRFAESAEAYWERRRQLPWT